MVFDACVGVWMKLFGALPFLEAANCRWHHSAWYLLIEYQSCSFPSIDTTNKLRLVQFLCVWLPWKVYFQCLTKEKKMWCEFQLANNGRVHTSTSAYSLPTLPYKEPSYFPYFVGHRSDTDAKTWLVNRGCGIFHSGLTTGKIKFPTNSTAVLFSPAAW